MKIALREYKLISLKFRMASQAELSEIGNDKFKLGIGNLFPDDSDQIFSIGFKIEIIHKHHKIDLEMRFIFQTDSKITDDFKNSHFTTINAPAIAFPYVRSFLSIFTLQSGYEPLMIPSVNFVELAKQN